MLQQQELHMGFFATMRKKGYLKPVVKAGKTPKTPQSVFLANVDALMQAIQSNGALNDKWAKKTDEGYVLTAKIGTASLLDDEAQPSRIVIADKKEALSILSDLHAAAEAGEFKDQFDKAADSRLKASEKRKASVASGTPAKKTKGK